MLNELEPTSPADTEAASNATDSTHRTNGRFRNAIAALHDDTAGAMSVEKVLILALIALPILIVLFLFRKTIVGWFQDQENQLKP